MMSIVSGIQFGKETYLFLAYLLAALHAPADGVSSLP